MGLEELKHEIIAQAEREAKKKVDVAREQAKKELDAAHQCIDAFEAEADATMQKEIELLEKKYHAQSMLASKKILLQKKKALLDNIFEECKELLIAFPASRRSSILPSLFEQAKKQCSAGVIYCAKQDIPLVKRFFHHVQEKPLIGGIIVENKDGTFSIDLSFDSMLQTLKETKLQEVAALYV